MTTWIMLNSRPDDLGLIPSFFLDSDPRPAREQLNERYAHGGGWHPMTGFTLDSNKLTLNYPEDPPLRMLAMANLHHEKIMLFEYSWMVIQQKDGSYEVGRVD